MIINKENINNLPEIIITAPKSNVLEAHDANPALIENDKIGILYYPVPITLESIFNETIKDEEGILPHGIYLKSKYDLNNRYYEFSIFPEKEFILKSQVLKQIFGYLGAKKRIKILFERTITDKRDLEEKEIKKVGGKEEGRVGIKNIGIEEKANFDYKRTEINRNNFYKVIKQAINEDIKKCKFAVDFSKAKELAIKTGIWDDSFIGIDIRNIIEGVAKYSVLKKEVDFYFEIKGKIERVYELLFSSTVSGGIGVGGIGINLLLGGRYETYKQTCNEFHNIKEIKVSLEIQF